MKADKKYTMELDEEEVREILHGRTKSPISTKVWGLVGILLLAGILLGFWMEEEYNQWLIFCVMMASATPLLSTLFLDIRKRGREVRARFKELFDGK